MPTPKAPKKTLADQVILEQVDNIRSLDSEDRENLLLAMKEDLLNLMTGQKKEYSEIFHLTERQFMEIFKQVRYRMNTTFMDLGASLKRPARKAQGR